MACVDITSKCGDLHVKAEASVETEFSVQVSKNTENLKSIVVVIKPKQFVRKSTVHQYTKLCASRGVFCTGKIHKYTSVKLPRVTLVNATFGL